MKTLKKILPISLALLAFLVLKKAQAAILPTSSPESWTLNQIPEVFNNFKSLLYELGGGVAVLLLIYAGFTYVTAYGNEERATMAKKIIIWTIVGVVVIMCASIIISEITKIIS